MSTVAQKLLALSGIKSAIRNAINGKGGSVPPSAPFGDYAAAITALPEGGGGGDGALWAYGAPTVITVRAASGVTSIHGQAYRDHTIPTGLVIEGPDLIRVEDNAFRGWSSATTLVISAPVTRIGQNSFRAWASASALTLPDGVSLIESYAFQGWASALSVSIPGSVRTIRSNAFEGWLSAGSLTIPEGVVTIESTAFQEWRAATSLTLPSTLTSIGAYAFANWHAMTTLDVHAETPPSASANSFSNLPAAAVIRVPAGSVDAYKSASGWSAHAAKIIAIP